MESGSNHLNKRGGACADGVLTIFVAPFQSSRQEDAEYAENTTVFPALRLRVGKRRPQMLDDFEVVQVRQLRERGVRLGLVPE